MNYIHTFDIKKIIFLFIATLTTIIAVRWYTSTAIAAQHCIVHPQYQETVPTAIREHLNALETEIWQKLAKLGVSKEQFEQAYQNQFPHPTRHEDGKCHFDEGISRENRELIVTLLQEQQVNPATITVRAIDIPAKAAAGNNTLFINEQRFNKVPVNQKRAILRHEIQHLKFYDAYSMALFGILLNVDPNTVFAQRDHILTEISRFQETRADLLSLSYSPDAADDFVAYMEKTIAMNFPDEPSHPSDKERLAWGQNIVAHFDAQPQGEIHA